jgi:fumarate reductase subunit C
MEEQVIEFLQESIVVIGSLGALTFLLPPQIAKYFNIIGKIASIIAIGLKQMEQKELFKKGK